MTMPMAKFLIAEALCLSLDWQPIFAILRYRLSRAAADCAHRRRAIALLFVVLLTKFKALWIKRNGTPSRGRTKTKRLSKLEAVSAIYWTPVTRFKRNLTRLSTFSTNGIKQLARSSIASRIVPSRVCFPCLAAVLATLRFVCKSLFCKELLFISSKYEFTSTVFTSNCFVVKHKAPH